MLALQVVVLQIHPLHSSFSVAHVFVLYSDQTPGRLAVLVAAAAVVH